jgi:hypothetical protein
MAQPLYLTPTQKSRNAAREAFNNPLIRRNMMMRTNDIVPFYDAIDALDDESVYADGTLFHDQAELQGLNLSSDTDLFSASGTNFSILGRDETSMRSFFRGAMQRQGFTSARHAVVQAYLKLVIEYSEYSYRCSNPEAPMEAWKIVRELTSLSNDEIFNIMMSFVDAYIGSIDNGVNGRNGSIKQTLHTHLLGICLNLKLDASTPVSPQGGAKKKISKKSLRKRSSKKKSRTKSKKAKH